MDLSVVVCAYDGGRFSQLQATLQSLARASHRPAETILVVDHNTSLLTRARREFPEAIVVENSGNRGLCGARNTGIATASGSVVAFLDDDAVASP